jgi:formate--tetrahydrofolate ligase
LKPIGLIAKELGIDADLLNPYGKYKAKILTIPKFEEPAKSKLILVTAITPTPQGEGKTVTSIGLSSALNMLGKKTIVCLRQPSLGPLFGVKGGAAGGGRSKVEPMQEVNMSLTGDIYAITSAHDLLSAMIDNHVFHGNELQIKPEKVTWKRTIDMNDRALRKISVALNEKKETPRLDAFMITAASEVMAVLCLSKSFAELKEKLSRIMVGWNEKDTPLFARDLNASGAMAAILRDSMYPNLVQTSDETPAFVHGGPFGNIATGTCSLVSIRLAQELAEYCVVEAGFGSDLGAEKFIDIVSRAGNLKVDCAVLVVSLKALEYQGRLDPKSSQETLSERESALLRGLENMEKHIENMELFGLTPVVALNKFEDDEDKEIKIVEQRCKELGVSFATSTVFKDGGKGGLELANKVIETASRGINPKPIYDLKDSVEEKIEKIVTKIYGGSRVEYTENAKNSLARISELGLGGLPICVAKTPLSLSDDPKKLGRPRNFNSTVTDLSISSGAGFIVVYMGDIMTMPGLPKHPAAMNIQLLDDGTITGIF